ncbi:MAG: EAL domain-containing protein [Treponema sp.]|nr:EAL domain-containing protein [Treponema sp.]
MKKGNIDSTLKKLTRSHGIPNIVLALLLVIYVLTTMCVTKSAQSKGFITLSGARIPIPLFTGVFSSLSNICIIFLVVFFRKPGFIAALAIILCYQMPAMTIAIAVRHNFTAVSGIFSTIFTIISITIIYMNNNRIEKYQERIRNQAVTDGLTALPNRFACSELMNSLIKKGEPFAVVSADLNNFKSINDTMGHEVGNVILIEIANRWKHLADSQATGTIDFVSRTGGDEYYLVIKGFNTEKDAENTIAAYAEELERKITISNCDYFLTASFGYALFPADADNTGTLFSYADAAMHERKRQGSGNKTLHFTPNLIKTEQVLEIERKIRTALDNDTILFNLQPQYYMSHKLRGFEILARMKDADGSFIRPIDFIPVAEKTGLIDQIDSCVFRKAACFIGKLIKDTDSDIILCTNVSVMHLMKNNFIEELQEIVQESGLAPSHFEVEITESIMIESAEKALKCINEIKKMGIKIAIDDFGTGYSSLSYLNKFPADMLKIDKSFIDVMNSSESSRQYVATIISIGHVLNLDVISEGVETEDQLETLKTIGCDYIQGYLWGRPLPPEEAEKLVKASLKS